VRWRKRGGVIPEGGSDSVEGGCHPENRREKEKRNRARDVSYWERASRSKKEEKRTVETFEEKGKGGKNRISSSTKKKTEMIGLLNF